MTKRILILDDDDDFREDLAEFLVGEGHEVVGIGDARAMPLERMCRFDVILLDLSMPACDGTDVLKQIAASCSLTSVIIISGSAQDVISAVADAARLRNIQIRGTLKKPFDPQALLALLETGPSLAAGTVAREDGPSQAVLAAALDRALDAGTLPVMFQPKMETQSLRFAGAETLLGTALDGIGPVSPPEMVAAAGSVDGLLSRLTMETVRAGIAAHACWEAAGRHGPVSVNVPLNVFLEPDAGRGIAAGEEFKRELLAKVRSLGQKALRRSGRDVPAPKPGERGPAAAPVRAPAPAARTANAERLRPFSMSPVKVLAVGSSTGGPQALTRLFSAIGPSLGNLPVFITQHMPVTFTAILAEHVSRAAGLPAAEGIDGEEVRPGRIYVAPGGRHMLVERGPTGPVIRLSDGPPVNFCKPAVDPMFGAIAAAYRGNVLALVLTGMGSDGAKGAGVIADAGGSVIVQDEETSVVWGMPGATVAAGNACEVLPLDAIGRKVVRLLEGGRS